MGQGSNYWHESTGDTVTLERGMSEGGLYRTLTQGFHPMTSVSSTMGDVVRKLMRDLPVAQEFIDVITHATEGESGHRAGQIGAKQFLFACLGPDSSNARFYAETNAANGGEVVTRIHNAIKDHYPDVQPLYPGARPVLVAFDTPRANINEHLANQENIASLLKDGHELSDLVDMSRNRDITLNSLEGVAIKSVTFAKMGPDGKWTFEGQPALSPAEALEAIQDKFNPEKQQSMVSKFAGRSWKDLTDGDMFQTITKSEIGKFLTGKTDISTAISKLGGAVEEYTGLAPKEVADFCADMLKNPSIDNFTQVAEQGYGKAMKALQSIDAPAALEKAKEHLDKYGGIAAVAAVATAVVAAAAPSPIRKAVSAAKMTL